ncbi:hypothetical protein JG688_00009318, partial [Phytophthora aleatoria]
ILDCSTLYYYRNFAHAISFFGISGNSSCGYHTRHECLPLQAVLLYGFRVARKRSTRTARGAIDAFGMIEKCIEWVKGVDVEAGQLWSLFGDGNLIDTDDVCTCFANTNLQNGEENALLNLVIDNAEDVAMTAAIFVICADVNSRPQARCANKCNPQLMGMSTDQEKRDRLKRVELVDLAENKIVGALWIEKKALVRFGFSLDSYVHRYGSAKR